MPTIDNKRIDMRAKSYRNVEFHSLKQLLNRFNASRDIERTELISIDDFDLPSWQRQLVWTTDDMGLLAYSILMNYPIGMIVLWKKPDGIRVPIDGRQRLTAIKQFMEGLIAIPSLNIIPDVLKNAKYKLLPGDEDKGYKRLSLESREFFEDYEPSIVEFENIDEKTAMDIFVKLQGGKSLTKAEIRAALGGKLCDFVTELTSDIRLSEDEESMVEDNSKHPFFKVINLPNTRKTHRNLCDVLLHENLYPGQDKHWTSLETMYLDKSSTLTEAEKESFRLSLNRFYKAIKGDQKISYQLKSTYLILTFYKAWKELIETIALPAEFNFLSIIEDFEKQRISYKDEIPWVIFTSALSNAGYAKNRLDTRHHILMNFILIKFPELVLKDQQRLFSTSQKLAIWERANHQCEWIDNGIRCQETFSNFQAADADHIVKWNDGGPTTVENGRLLCRCHNRGRR